MAKPEYYKLLSYVHKLEERHGSMSSKEIKPGEKVYLKKLSKPCYDNTYVVFTPYEYQVIKWVVDGTITPRRAQAMFCEDSSVTMTFVEQRVRAMELGKYTVSREVPERWVKRRRDYDAI